jgi:hypothetical protein
MASERGIGDAVDQARVLPDEVIEYLVWTAVSTTVSTARYRHDLAQNCFSRKQLLDLNHEDRRNLWFVQEILWENV